MTVALVYFRVLSFSRRERMRFPFWTLGPHLLKTVKLDQARFTTTTFEAKDSPSYCLLRCCVMRELLYWEPAAVFLHTP